MPASAKPQRSTERVVVLLTRAEKERLSALADTEQVSAGEILRRSLAAYSGEGDLDLQHLLRELNLVLDRSLASMAENRKHIAANLAKVESQRLSREADVRLNELYEQAIAEHGKSEVTKSRKKKAA